jgi:hypothetical protein
MNVVSTKQRRRWPWFLAGVLLTLLLTGATVLIMDVGRGLAAWGTPQVITDEAVRARLTERGVKLPPTAHKLYHSIAGFVDHSEYIAFSATPDECLAAAVAYAKRSSDRPEFKDGIRSQYDFINEGPGHWGDEWKTPLWDIQGVINGRVYEERHLFVLIDTDASRVFISTWSE